MNKDYFLMLGFGMVIGAILTGGGFFVFLGLLGSSIH